jgi:hypothetical protein
MSWSSGKATVTGTSSGTSKLKGKAQQSTTALDEDDADDDDGAYARDTARRDGQILTTLSLLQTLHAHTAFQRSALEALLPVSSSNAVVTLTSKDMAALELGPLSGADARYLEWFASEYGGGARVVVKRGWREMIGAIFGYG